MLYICPRTCIIHGDARRQKQAECHRPPHTPGRWLDVARGDRVNFGSAHARLDLSLRAVAGCRTPAMRPSRLTTPSKVPSRRPPAGHPRRHRSTSGRCGTGIGRVRVALWFCSVMALVSRPMGRLSGLARARCICPCEVNVGGQHLDRPGRMSLSLNLRPHPPPGSKAPCFLTVQVLHHQQRTLLDGLLWGWGWAGR